MYVLVKVSGGLINEVLFFEDATSTVKMLAEFVKTMNIQDDDAAVFGPKGLVANAKHFLDFKDRFINAKQITRNLIRDINDQKPIYIIGNPVHHLGFMVAGPDEPLGYTNPAEVISDLGQAREDDGRHLKLYRVIPVTRAVAGREDVEKYNQDNEVEGFDYSLVEEYLQ